jgi:predicted transcriptional regulator
MELGLPQHQIDSLAALAARVRKSPGELVVEAVDRLLADENWFDRQVEIGIDQIARGQCIEEAEMDERVRRMMRA